MNSTISIKKFPSTKSVVAFIGTKYGMKYKVSIKLYVAELKKSTVIAAWYNKDEVADAAELAMFLDTMKDWSKLTVKSYSEWNGELNVKF